MPLVLGVVFLALFGAANPVIDYWLSLIDLWRWLDLIELVRLVFWVFMLVLVWAFLRPRLPYFLRRPPRLPAFALLASQPRVLRQTARRRASRTSCSARRRSCARCSSST